MKKIIFLSFLLAGIVMVYGQNKSVGINTTPDASAILDIASTAKGFLMPRMTTAQRDSIALPVTGLQIFNIDDQCTDIFDGTNWMKTCGLKVTSVITDPGHLTQNSWTQKANFGGSNRLGAVSFSFDNKGYIGTGVSDGGFMNDLWQYDPSTNSWTQKASMGGEGREFAVGFSIGSIGYIGTGISEFDKKNDFWQYDILANTWIQKADFGGTARNGAVGFSIGGDGYIGTGIDHFSIKQDFWKYDTLANSWIQKADFGGDRRFNAISFSIGNKGYIGTGELGGLKKDFWQYDPDADIWTQKTDFGGTAREYAVGFSIGNKGYIGTGLDEGNNIMNDFWQYDTTTNSWTQKADVGGVPRYYASGFSIGNKGYIGTGYGNTSFKNDFWEYMDNNILSLSYSSATGSSTGKTTSDGLWAIKNNDIYNANTGTVGVGTTTPDTTAILDINSTTQGFLMPRMTTVQRNAIALPAVGLQIFNLDDQCTDIFDGTNWIKTCGLKITGSVIAPGHPTPNSWTQKANFGGIKRAFSVAFSIGNKGYIGTGHGGSLTNDFWQYDPAINTWTQKADFGGSARSGAVGFNIGNKGYIGTGGDGSSNKNDFWQYDPAINTWTQKTDFGGSARSGAVGFSIGNKGYIGTGYNGSILNDFWQYDTTTNTWTQKADFGGDSRVQATGFSIGNKGYIGTGYNTGSYKNDFWQYDTITNTWTQKADFGGDSRMQATGFSIGNKGYIGTGYNSGSYKNDFWQYDTITNTWTQKADFGGDSRTQATGFSIGNKGYIGTGAKVNFYNDFWEYVDDNIIGNVYSSSTISATNNIISDGAWTMSTNNVYNANSGNVGIGTTTPATKLEVNGSIRQKVYSQEVTVPANGSMNFTWTHNLGYQPIVMLIKEGANFQYVQASYGHTNNNALVIYLTNRTGAAATGTAKWVVVY